MSRNRQKDDSVNFEARLNVFRYCLVAIFVALGIRFYVLQVVHHSAYEQQADNNRIREIPIKAARGAILDRNGNPLVDNTPASNITLYRENMINKQETIDALVDNLGVDRQELLKEMSNPNRPKSSPILVKQNASDADRAWVAAHSYEHPEIEIENQPQRFYKYGTLAAQVLGYVGEITPKELEDPKFAGYEPGEIIGEGGIERIYDKLLRGKDGERRVIVDSRGRPIRELDRIEPIKGQDIVTTLDLNLQQVAEQQFDQAGETGVAIAEDPQTGEILAMVSKPAFDPNVFAKHVVSAEDREEVGQIMTDPSNPLFNKAIQGTYPTGSTWKILMATAALEDETITTKNSRIICGGGIQVGNRFVHCMGNHGTPDIHAAIVHSCDGYFYRLGLKLGVDKIHEWVTKFGMGQKTGIDLPSEQKGSIPSRDWKAKVNPRDPVWKDFDTVLASVGQGSVAVTPIQLLHAEGGIMMGGEFHVPHVFKEARATQILPAQHYVDHPTTLHLSQTTIDTVSYAVWGVVNEGGTAGSVGFPRDLNVGGKTGTAQVIAREKVHGKETKDHAWFISFAPLHTNAKPELAVVVLTEHGGFGAQASAPKSKMINAAFFSKKLGHPVLPDLVAKSEPDQGGGSPAHPAISRPAALLDRKEPVFKQ